MPRLYPASACPATVGQSRPSPPSQDPAQGMSRRSRSRSRPLHELSWVSAARSPSAPRLAVCQLRRGRWPSARSLHDVPVKLRTPAAVAGAVGAISLTACSFTAPLAAPPSPRPDAGHGQLRGPAYPATAAGPSTPVPPGSTGAAAAPSPVAAIGDMMLGRTPDLPARPGDVPEPRSGGSSAPGARIVFGEPRRHADHGHGQQMRPGRAPGPTALRSAIRQITRAASRTPGSRS